MKRSYLPLLVCGIAGGAAVLLADVWFGGYKSGLQGITTIPKGSLVLHEAETCAFKAVAFFSDTGASDVTAAAVWTLSASSNLIVWDDEPHHVIKAINNDNSLDRAALSAAYGGYTAVVRVASFNTAYVPDADADNIADEWECSNGLSSVDSGDALQCWYTNNFPRAALSNNLLLFVLDATVPPRPEFPTNFWTYTTNNWGSAGYWADADADGLPDGWEYSCFPGNLSQLSHYGDYDNDGLTDYEEYLLGSNPTVSDTDHDSVGDYMDINAIGENPQSVVVVRYPEPGGEI